MGKIYHKYILLRKYCLSIDCFLFVLPIQFLIPPSPHISKVQSACLSITYFHAEINELKFLGNANLPTAITFLFINEAFFEPNEINRDLE